jgi:hypothetical protein
VKVHVPSGGHIPFRGKTEDWKHILILNHSILAAKLDNATQLCGFIAEKHERFLSQYRQELASLERILVLQEEIDQFNHWISSGKLNYEEKRARALVELEGLKKTFGKKISAKSLDAVRQKIKDHEFSLGYWHSRVKGR